MIQYGRVRSYRIDKLFAGATRGQGQSLGSGSRFDLTRLLVPDVVYLVHPCTRPASVRFAARGHLVHRVAKLNALNNYFTLGIFFAQSTGYIL